MHISLKNNEKTHFVIWLGGKCEFVKGLQKKKANKEPRILSKVCPNITKKNCKFHQISPQKIFKFHEKKTCVSASDYFKIFRHIWEGQGK